MDIEKKLEKMKKLERKLIKDAADKKRLKEAKEKLRELRRKLRQGELILDEDYAERTYSQTEDAHIATDETPIKEQNLISEEKSVKIGKKNKSFDFSDEEEEKSPFKRGPADSRFAPKEIREKEELKNKDSKKEVAPKKNSLFDDDDEDGIKFIPISEQIKRQNEAAANASASASATTTTSSAGVLSKPLEKPQNTKPEKPEKEVKPKKEKAKKGKVEVAPEESFEIGSGQKVFLKVQDKPIPYGEELYAIVTWLVGGDSMIVGKFKEYAEAKKVFDKEVANIQPYICDNDNPNAVQYQVSLERHVFSGDVSMKVVDENIEKKMFSLDFSKNA